MQPKYIFITGGVISSLGKGITSASIGKLLQDLGFKVVNIKCEMYVNIDAGTIRPTEHGEVYVTEDGMECDQDLGTYERFLNQDITKECFLTTGQIYQEVIRRERNLEYDGEDVEVVPHVPKEIIRRIKISTEKNKADFAIVEFGGTVGEYQQVLFLEADRMMKHELKKDILNIHIAYLPIPPSVGEMKSKPAQYSVRTLFSAGIVPDIFIGRSTTYMDQHRMDVLSRNTNIAIENIFSNPDVKSIYEVPLILAKQKVAECVLGFFGVKPRKKASLTNWKKLVKTIKEAKKEIKIGIVGKYFASGDFSQGDSYISVIEAIKHACCANNVTPIINWIDAESFERDPKKVVELKENDGIIVPGGYGKRGVEGKINAVKFARENKIPFLGLCYGLQMAVIEFSRNICKIKDANTTENEPNTKNPVIDVMEAQKKLLAKKQYGASNRLGAYECKIKKDTKAFKAYGKETIQERHRHRYEVNNKYKEILEKNGLKIVGINPKLDLAEIIELENHPWFVGTQFHPEFKSRLENPHPLFVNFIKAAINNNK